MNTLDRKLWRDLLRVWAQGLAIAMVLAAGVATLVLAIGAARSLTETRETYYERYRFADVFAGAKRVPNDVIRQLEAIPGIAAVDIRVTEAALLDIEGQPEPATGLFVSLPALGEPRLNVFKLRAGRMPDPDSTSEILATEAFAQDHGFLPGAHLDAILNGRKRTLTITGIAMSPEFIYALGPGDLVPDDRRFGAFAMPYEALASAYDLEGAFNSVSAALLRGTSPQAVIREIDRILAPYGGTGAYAREDHQSHAFIDAELVQLRNLSLVIPPIFLGVAAFLVNITIARMITLERELIGLMKAVGYSTLAVGWHYTKLVALIALVGIVIGWIGGHYLGRGLTVLYGDFFHFPFLIFLTRADVYLLSGAAALASALLGALNAIRRIVGLPPAVAMSPPAPPRYRHLMSKRLGLLRHTPQSLNMALRNIMRWPVRTGLTVLGLALSIAVLVGSLFARESVDQMMEHTFFVVDRQEATLTFNDIRPMRSLQEAGRLPGVILAEPYRTVPVRLRNGTRIERSAIYGKTPDPDLSRVVDLDLRPVSLPDQGLALSETLAGLLNVGRGDVIEVEILEGRRERVHMTVTTVIQQYLGVGAYMRLGALNRLMRDGNVVSGVHLAVDPAEQDDLFATVKDTPVITAIALQRRALELFRQTMARNILIMTTVYTVLAAVIGFGVVYNSVRIQLSERARELASLRVLGFTRAEVSLILLGELAILALLAMPLGWVLGYGLAWSVTQGLQSELYRVPLVVGRETYGYATLVFLTVGVVSALLVRRRIDQFDLIAVLKTRD